MRPIKSHGQVHKFRDLLFKRLLSNVLTYLVLVARTFLHSNVSLAF